MKFSYKQKKISACAFFITDFRFAETVLEIFFKKFFDFSVAVGSTEKNGSQRQKLTRKICKTVKSISILC